MIARLIIDGILHKVIVRRDTDKNERIARIHKLDGTPVSVLREVANIPNLFVDTAQPGEQYLLRPGSMKKIRSHE